MCPNTFPVPTLAALSLVLALPAAALDDTPTRAMKDELARTMTGLRLPEMERPYFVAFWTEDVDGLAVSAELGSLTSALPDRSRRVGVELRVGTPELDNGNWLSANRFGAPGIADLSWCPLDDDYQQIRRQLWLTTDGLYKRALEDLTAKRAAVRGRAAADALPDFTGEPAASFAEPWARRCPPRAEAEALVRQLSAVFRASPEIRASSAKLWCRDAWTRYVSSEGTSLARAEPRLELEVEAELRAATGRPVSDSFELYGRGGADLPSRDELLRRTRALLARLLALRASPSPDRYTGPVLFEGIAAAEVFGFQLAPGFAAVRPPVSDDARFEGAFDRFQAQAGGASFADKVGASVLPPFLSVTDDPTRKDHRGASLHGTRRFDDEGVATRVTKLVERGRLKALLSTRTPSRAAPRSTGSRRGAAAAPSNLIVTAEKGLPKARLRRELLSRARARGLDHAIVVRHAGAVAASPLLRQAAHGLGRGDGQGAALLEVWRVYADGREEPLHGMELADLTAASFKEIVAAGDAPEVHTLEFLGNALPFASFGRAGGLPLVSYVVPALLFDELTLLRSRAPIPDAPSTPSPLAAR